MPRNFGFLGAKIANFSLLSYFSLFFDLFNILGGLAAPLGTAAAVGAGATAGAASSAACTGVEHLMNGGENISGKLMRVGRDTFALRQPIHSNCHAKLAILLDYRRPWMLYLCGHVKNWARFKR